MPSFDVVSELNHHEVENAVDQTRREIDTRFDFRGVVKFSTLQIGDVITLDVVHAPVGALAGDARIPCLAGPGGGVHAEHVAIPDACAIRVAFRQHGLRGGGR